MKKLSFIALTLLLGFGFSWVLTAAQAISWYRIQEMFYFKSFHMYGLLGSAIATGALSLWLIRRFNIKSVSGTVPSPKAKPVQWKANVAGGLIFGAGWGITGACSAPLFIWIGLKWQVGALLVAGALSGTLLYALLKNKLPHE